MESMITLASISLEKDYRRDGLNMARMGLEGLSPEAVLAAVT